MSTKRKVSRPINACPSFIKHVPGFDLRSKRKKEVDGRARLPVLTGQAAYVAPEAYTQKTHREMCLEVTDGLHTEEGAQDGRVELYGKLKSQWRSTCRRCEGKNHTEWDLEGLTLHYFQAHHNRRLCGTYEFCPFCQNMFLTFIPGDPKQGVVEELHMCKQRARCVEGWNNMVHIAARFEAC